MRPSNPLRAPAPIRYWRLQPIQLVVIDLNDWLFRFAAVNLLWVLLATTIILLPPATAALFDTAHQSYRGRKPEVRRFLASLRRWFWRSWAWAAANLLVFGALLLIARTVFDNDILLGVVGVVAALVMIAQFWFWPYAMIQEAPDLPRALRNSVFTALGDLPYLTFYLVLVLAVLIPSVIAIAPLLLIAPAVLSLLVTYSLIVWLQQHGILKEPKRDL
ncbi:MAG: DUF624 domain-containing protein [Chloroflexota bacterium]|nr:MAG: hypothetical protein DIU68_02950 [Chloroflexota bacterium]